MSITSYFYKLVLVKLLLLLVACTHQADIPSRGGETNDSINDRIQELTLSDGRVIVVAEGAREPRSIGSFSVRLYSPDNVNYPYDRFVVGVVSPRDGSVEKIMLEDLDYKGDKELVVVTRSAGSGSYLSAYAFFVTDKQVVPALFEEGMKPGSDVIGTLKSALKSRQ